jgi:RimJ/RimL family protein N-acetyltransferase
MTIIKTSSKARLIFKNKKTTTKKKPSPSIPIHIPIPISKSRRTTKTKTKASKLEDQDKLKLVSLDSLNSKHVDQLSRITGNKATMKWIGRGNIWTRTDLHHYIKDEKKEQTKVQEKDKQYYSFVLLRDNIPIGFISGRKGALLDAPAGHDYNLLLRMFIDAHLTGHGYGTRIIEMFIKKYKEILAHGVEKVDMNKVELVADINPSNIASIKIHQKNKFTLAKRVIYKDGKHLLRYTRSLAL